MPEAEGEGLLLISDSGAGKPFLQGLPLVTFTDPPVSKLCSSMKIDASAPTLPMLPCAKGSSSLTSL